MKTGASELKSALKSTAKDNEKSIPAYIRRLLLQTGTRHGSEMRPDTGSALFHCADIMDKKERLTMWAALSKI